MNLSSHLVLYKNYGRVFVISFVVNALIFAVIYEKNIFEIYRKFA